MNHFSAGEVPASPEMPPLNFRESPGLTTPTAPASAIAAEMNVHRTTETTTTGAWSGVSDDKLVEPESVLVSTRLPQGVDWQEKPKQQPHQAVLPGPQHETTGHHATRAWGLATKSSNSTKTNSQGITSPAPEPQDNRDHDHGRVVWS